MVLTAAGRPILLGRPQTVGDPLSVLHVNDAGDRSTLHVCWCKTEDAGEGDAGFDNQNIAAHRDTLEGSLGQKPKPLRRLSELDCRRIAVSYVPARYRVDNWTVEG